MCEMAATPGPWDAPDAEVSAGRGACGGAGGEGGE